MLRSRDGSLDLRGDARPYQRERGCRQLLPALHGLCMKSYQTWAHEPTTCRASWLLQRTDTTEMQTMGVIYSDCILKVSSIPPAPLPWEIIPSILELKGRLLNPPVLAVTAGVGVFLPPFLKEIPPHGTHVRARSCPLSAFSAAVPTQPLLPGEISTAAPGHSGVLEEEGRGGSEGKDFVGTGA